VLVGLPALRAACVRPAGSRLRHLLAPPAAPAPACNRPPWPAAPCPRSVQTAKRKFRHSQEALHNGTLGAEKGEGGERAPQRCRSVAAGPSAPASPGSGCGPPAAAVRCFPARRFCHLCTCMMRCPSPLALASPQRVPAVPSLPGCSPPRSKARAPPQERPLPLDDRVGAVGAAQQPGGSLGGRQPVRALSARSLPALPRRHVQRTGCRAHPPTPATLHPPLLPKPPLYP
jgi:hypothetical protein